MLATYIIGVRMALAIYAVGVWVVLVQILANLIRTKNLTFTFWKVVCLVLSLALSWITVILILVKKLWCKS